MPLHNIPRKAVSQPKGSPKVARAYQDGLLAVFHAPVVTPDWTPAGTVLKAPASIGLCFESSGAGSRYDKTVAENQSTGFTMLAHFVVRVTTVQDYAGVYNGATYQSLIYVSGGTKLQFFPKNGLGVQAHSKTPAIGDVVSICASADGASYHIATTINGATEIVSGTYTGTSAYNNLHIGAKFTGTGSHRTALAAFWKRALPLEQVRALGSKPWRVFNRRAAQVFSNAVAGGDVGITGAASGSASSSVDLTTEIRVSGDASSAASAQAALTTAITVTASASASAAAAAGLTTEIRVTGGAFGSATATMDLGATSAAIAGDIVCSSAASANLTTAILITGAATGAATAEATLDGSTPAEITGDAFASATAFAQITTAILIAGATSGSGAAAMTLFEDDAMLENVADRTMRIPRESRSFRIPAERESMSIRAERAVKVRTSGSRS